VFLLLSFFVFVPLFEKVILAQVFRNIGSKLSTRVNNSKVLRYFEKYKLE